jgi:hypothetical protein
MSIDFSIYKKKLKEKKELKFKAAAGGDIPKRIANLAQHSDTTENHYFTYRNYHGTVNGYVERKEADQTNDGKKKFIPYSLTEDGEWQCKAWPDNRCLYNEHLLKQHPDKPVLISEGEKAAAYGTANYKDYVHVSFQGGSNLKLQIKQTTNT